MLDQDNYIYPRSEVEECRYLLRGRQGQYYLDNVESVSNDPGNIIIDVPLL